MTVYERLQEECSKKNISITSLCLQATGNKGNLDTWKKNNGHMKSDYLENCADILNCSVDYLLGREKNTVTTADITNSGIIGVVGNNNAPVSIRNGKERMLTVQEQDLLRIYNSIDGKKQTELMHFAYSLEENKK